MSIRLMTEVWTKEIDGIEQLALLVMADYANDDGSSVFPSIATVAWKLGVHERTAQRHLKKLRDKGALVKVADARQHHPVEYRIDLSALADKPPLATPNQGRQSATPAPNQGRQLAAPGVTNGASRGDAAAPPEPPVVEPPEEPTEGDPVDRLCAVWQKIEGREQKPPTPSQARVIRKGLAEATVEECIHALFGRRAWLDANRPPGTKLELSSVFQSRPDGSPLREQIEFYVSQAPASRVDDQPSGFPSAPSARIARAKDEVRTAADMEGSHTARVRGERAMEWLKEHGIGVRYDDGQPVFEPLPPPSEPEAA